MCTKGPTLQNLIVNTTGMLQSLKDVTTGNFACVSTGLDIKAFQLIANLVVKNEWSQEKVWNFMSDVILAKFELGDSAFVNVAAMIIHNIILNKNSQLDEQKIFKICLNHYKAFLSAPTNQLPDFVSILTDFLICQSSDVVDIYKQLEPEYQKTALYYVHDYIENESNE